MRHGVLDARCRACAEERKGEEMNSEYMNIDDSHYKKSVAHEEKIGVIAKKNRDQQVIEFLSFLIDMNNWEEHKHFNEYERYNYDITELILKKYKEVFNL